MESINVQLKNGATTLTASTNIFHALPRLIAASSSIKLQDDASYDIVSTKTGVALNPAEFDFTVRSFLEDTPRRYVLLASERAKQLVSEL